METSLIYKQSLINTMKELIDQYHQQQNSTTGPQNIKGVPQ